MTTCRSRLGVLSQLLAAALMVLLPAAHSLDGHGGHADSAEHAPCHLDSAAHDADHAHPEDHAQRLDHLLATDCGCLLCELVHAGAELPPYDVIPTTPPPAATQPPRALAQGAYIPLRGLRPPNRAPPTLLT